MAGEAGPGRTRVELILAQPTGAAEVHEGTMDDGELMLRTTVVARSATAKEITEVERVYRLQGDQLDYRLAMAAVGQPLTHHLAGRLVRAASARAADR